MSTPSQIEVDAATTEKLAKLAISDPELLLAGLEARAEWQETSGLDSRTYHELGRGGPRTVAAAPELMVALGLSLPSGVDGEPDGTGGE